MMQKVEQRLCDRLMKEGKAAFYWDYDKYYMDGKNEAGHYIRQYLKYYPNELATSTSKTIYDNMDKAKDITYLQAPTENIQARYIRTWLLENGRYQQGRKTAIVLADESLLQAVIHSLPEEVENVNITIGYPLQQTPFFSLIQQLICMQTTGKSKINDSYRLHYITMVLRHPYARYISDKSLTLLQDLEENKRFYPSRDSLIMDNDEGLCLLFKDLEKEESFNLALVNYLLEVLQTIGTHAKNLEDPLFQESLFRTYTLLNRLRSLIESGDLLVDIITLERLIQQLIQTTSIPFHGEPAEGIQIMGVLETRNLDFEHILVLSCNEGNLPKGVTDSSFIPYSLRKAYELTTVDNKVAIYAYYFHSLLQRAGDITLAYNNATEDGHTGEMSRFMLQMMVESQHTIQRVSLTAKQNPLPPNYIEIEKTEEIMAVLNRIRTLTPTFLNTFIRCQKSFYFRYIKGIKKLEELEEEIDNRIFGLIYHRAAQLFYLQFASPSDLWTDKQGEVSLIHPIIITKGEIEAGLKNEFRLYQFVDEAFREEMFKVKDKRFKPIYNGLQLINREVIVSYLKQLLQIDLHLAPFCILGLEKKVEAEFDFETPNGKKHLKIGGIIDRLDSVAANGNPSLDNLTERIRVIDYKTGRAPQYCPKDATSIFDPKELSKHTDYYLQALLYSLIVKHDKKLNSTNSPVSPSLLFIQQSGTKDYDPTLKFGKEPIIDAAEHEEEFMEGIKQLISNIYNPVLPFIPTEDKQRCATCPYASLCK